ncbi:hypothetical protein BS78_02G074700, partial [Paspalum vaginatum]
MHMKNARELWEAIEHKYGTSDVSHEMYVIERYHDYKMVDNRFVVEQANEVHWWVDTEANIYVCADVFLFSSYQVTLGGSVLMGNGSRASILGIGTVDLKLTSGKIVGPKNVHHVPTINKNLVSGSMLCRDCFKLVLESNKIVVSRFGQFIGKGYDRGGLFHLSLSEFNNSVVNQVNNLS